MGICWPLKIKTLAHEIWGIACGFDNGTDEFRRASEEIIFDNAASNNGRAPIHSCLDNAGINGLARAHLNRQLITMHILWFDEEGIWLFTLCNTWQWEATEIEWRWAYRRYLFNQRSQRRAGVQTFMGNISLRTVIRYLDGILISSDWINRTSNFCHPKIISNIWSSGATRDPRNWRRIRTLLLLPLWRRLDAPWWWMRLELRSGSPRSCDAEW
jgi:hypothetical protein